jgi:hypothetical protein
MGKKWDTDKGGRKQWCAYMEERFAEALRVCKPGAYGLVWALPRTSHWTATALEDAGWELKDCVVHLFGSGFPKSQDIGKMIENKLGATPEAKQWDGFGTNLKPASENWILVRKPIAGTIAGNVLEWGVGGLNIDKTRVLTQDNEFRKQRILSGEVLCNAFCDKHESYPSSFSDIACFSPQQLLDFWKHIASELDLSSIFDTNLLHDWEDSEYMKCTQLLGAPCDCGLLFQRVSGYAHGHRQQIDSLSGYPTLSRLYGEQLRRESEVAQVFAPSNNDVLADIFRLLSLEENILRSDNNLHLVFVVVSLAYNWLARNNLHNHHITCKNKKQQGRFPANLVLSHAHDCTDDGCADGCPVKELDEQTEGTRASKSAKGGRCKENNSMFFSGSTYQDFPSYDDGGDGKNASRYFPKFHYFPKASTSDRSHKGQVQNNHPTVKNRELMRWLCRLVTPPGGTVLDCFAGSGSTAIACLEEGFNYILIEQDAESVQTANDRVNVWLKENKPQPTIEERLTWLETKVDAIDARTRKTKKASDGQLPLFGEVS